MTSRGDTNAPPFYRFFRDLFTDPRGQSEMIGVVLLIGITVIGAVSLVAFGSGMISETEHQMEVDSAQHSMGQLAGQSNEVAIDDTSSKSAGLPDSTGSGESKVVEDGWIHVEVVDTTNDSTRKEITEDPVPLGAIVYENDGAEIAYQGGGLWKTDGNDSEVVSPPEYHYRGETLTFPIIQVTGEDGNESVSDDVTIRTDGPTEQVYPNAEEGWTNPVEDGLVNVTVQSDYYEAWGQFFETRTDGTPHYDHENETVTTSLIVERGEEQTVEAGIMAGGTGTELQIDNQAYVSSYNSTENPPNEATENATIMVGGDLILRGSGAGETEVRGDVEVGGDADLQQHAHIYGNLSYSGSKSTHNHAEVHGWSAPNGSVDEPEPVDWKIDDKSQEFEGEENNSNETVESYLDDGEFRCDSGTCTIPDGQYWFESMEVTGGDLELDNSDGPIEIYVADDTSFHGDVTVESDDHRVSFYTEEHLEFADDVEVTVPGYRSGTLWFYMHSESNVEFGNDAYFTGVIYGPGTANNDGTTIRADNHASIHGALAGDADQFDNHVDLYYDEALAEEQAIDDTRTQYIPSVTFVHITVNSVEVSD